MALLGKKDVNSLKSKFKTITFNGKKYTIVDGMSSISETEYDEMGNRVQTIFRDQCGENLKVKTTYIYDENNKLIQADKTILQTGGKMTYKNKPTTVMKNKYDEDGNILETYNSEYTLTTELSNDGIITTTITYHDKPTKVVELRRKETDEILSVMEYTLDDKKNWVKSQGELFEVDGKKKVVTDTKYSPEGNKLLKTIETYEDDYLLTTVSYDQDGKEIFRGEIEYDIHPKTNEKLMRKHTMYQNGEKFVISYDYLDNGRLCRAINDNNEEIKIGMMNKGNIYHYIDYMDNYELITNDDIDEAISKNDIGHIYSYQFKKFNNASCSLCKFDNKAYQNAIKTNVLEYQFSDTDNLMNIESSVTGDNYITKIIRYNDKEMTKESTTEYVSLKGDPSIHLEYFDKFCQFTGTEFNSRGIYSIIGPNN